MKNLECILREVLTPTQYRRVTRFTGLDGQGGLGHRALAREEGRHLSTIQESLDQAWERLKDHVTLPASPLVPPSEPNMWDLLSANVAEEEVLDFEDTKGMGGVTLRPSGDYWSSDRGAPESCTDAVTEGWLAAHEKDLSCPYTSGPLRQAWQEGFDMYTPTVGDTDDL